MDRRVSRKMSKHQKRGIAAAYRHERSRPAVTYDVNVSTQDVGIAHDFQCVVCWRVLRHTVVCPNGHRCCNICVKTLARQIIFGGLAVCPLCRQSGMFRDAPEVDEELMRQQAKCPFVRSWSGQACQWTGPYGEMWNHVHHFADPPRTADHQAVDPSASATEQQTSRNGAA